MELVFLGVNDAGMRIYEWLCGREGVDVLAMLTEAEQLDIVQREEPDLLLSVGFGHFVPREILSVPTLGAVNVHPSYLPYNRGANPNVWPIVDDTPAGVSIHYMDEEFDTGDVIARQEVEFDFADTAKDLHERLERAQFELFTEVWPSIERGEVDATAQDAEAGTYHTTDAFADLCQLDPEETVTTRELLDRLRALTFPPFDNAAIEVDGETYYVDIDVRSEEEDRGGPEGLLSSY